jgi:SAM-dependent methyltransferase
MLREPGYVPIKRRSARVIVAWARRHVQVAWRRVVWTIGDLPDDIRLGIWTGRIHHGCADEDRQFFGYGAVAYRTLRDIRAHLRLHAPCVRRFVDAGCGLGRPLYFFAGERFDQLMGYEVAPSIFERSRRQLDRAKRRHKRFATISIEDGDATLMIDVTRDFVLLLYNPFGPVPMARLCHRLKDARVDVHIYYVNPVHAGTLEAVLACSGERIDSFIPVNYYFINGSGGSRP